MVAAWGEHPVPRLILADDAAANLVPPPRMLTRPAMCGASFSLRLKNEQ